ncbi:MAG: hypothetical protein MUF62_12940 [Chitinophagaceae bacterium]|nr:hypothetical protein [Chitinophagaceae bacterium]
MAQPTWRQRLSYYSLFVPVRHYLLFFVVAALLAWWWLQRQQPPEPSLAGSLLGLLVQAGLAAIGILLGLALLTVLVPFALFAWQLRSRRVRRPAHQYGHQPAVPAAARFFAFSLYLR